MCGWCASVSGVCVDGVLVCLVYVWMCASVSGGWCASVSGGWCASVSGGWCASVPGVCKLLW